ncbi:MAG: glycosyltransferase [Planctomycetia bacterium]|nr:glycosyltransferase [Planctomycetia bacterium]
MGMITIPEHRPKEDETLVQSSTYLIFSDDWGRHPSSCQHLTRFFLEKHRVLWVNTIGTRPPRLDWMTVRRGYEKITSWTRRGREQAEIPQGPQPEILHPVMWPWFRTEIDRRLNIWLLRHELRKALARISTPVIAITTLPIVADVMGVLPEIEKWIYYCVDDWSQWPGMDSQPLAEMEQKLVSRADLLISAGTVLRERLRQMGRESLLLTHGVDWEFWHPSAETFSTIRRQVPQDAPSPIYTFWGLIDERLDLAFIRHLAREISTGSLIFAGPIISPEVALELERIPHVRLLGKLPYADLPRLAHESDVLLMPYRDMEVTRQMQPLKMTEYLATGLPAVVRELPATLAWQEALDVVSSAEQFAILAQERAERGIPAGQQLARKRLSEESWQKKAAIFEEFIQTGTIS